MKKLLFITIGLLFLFSSFTFAESLRLSDGSIIQGKITSHDDKGITIKLLKTGSEVKLHWAQLAEKDKNRLRKDFGLDMPDYKGVFSVKGDRIETYDGKTYLGKIIEEDKTRIIIEFFDIDGNKDKEVIQKRKIRDTFKNISIPAQVLLPKEEVYQLILEKNPPVDAKTHYIMALYCLDIGLYSQGLYHIDECLSLDVAMENQVKELQTKLETLQNAREFRTSMNDISKMIKREKLAEAYTELKAILDNKELADELKGFATEAMLEWEITATDVISKRWYRLISATANVFVAKNEPELAEAKTYAGSQMDKDILAKLHSELNEDFEEAETPPINEKLIVALFKKRNPDKYPVIKISIAADAFGIKMSGSSKTNSSNKTNSNDLDLQKILEKLRSGSLTPEEQAELMKKYKNFMKGKVTKNIIPEQNDDDADNPDGIYFQGVRQGTNQRYPRSTNNNSSNNRTNSTNNRTNNNNSPNSTKKKATPAEIWKVASSSVRRNYVTYLYCSRNKNIKLQKEKRKGSIYYAWFR